MTHKSNTHKFNLIEDALDSFEHAIAHVTANGGATPGDSKRVILDLSHVAELLFKERLRQVHPAFVLAKVRTTRRATGSHVIVRAPVAALERLSQ